MRFRNQLLVALLSIHGAALAQGVFAGDACEMRPGKSTTPLQTIYERKLSELKSCAVGDGRAVNYSACNVFVGRALEVLYQNTDFKANGGYVLANEIAEKLALGKEPGWGRVGTANDQAALDQAHMSAEMKRPVLAVKHGGSEAGHVAIILPGDMEQASNPKWSNLRMPNSASFFKNNAPKSFVGCPLDQVWRAGPADVVLYHKP